MANNNFMNQGYGFQNYYPNIPQLNSYYQQPSNTNKIFVSGIADVKSRPLPANSNVMFLDNEKPYVYEKIVDSAGKYEVNTYELKKVVDTTESVVMPNELSGFVKTAEFDALKSKIEGIEEQISKLGKGEQ